MDVNMSRLYSIKAVLLCVGILFSAMGCDSSDPGNTQSDSYLKEISKPLESLHGPYRVLKVTDGDTIHVLRDAVDVRVRIIGVNTPEVYRGVQCFGPEASEFAKSEMANTSIYLEYDSTQSELDKYGRVLAHVWTATKQLYAAEAIRNGFGFEANYADVYHHRALFLDNQKTAQQEVVGLWANCRR